MIFYFTEVSLIYIGYGLFFCYAVALT